MRTIIEEYGHIILAAVVTAAVLSVFWALWRGSLRESLMAYEDSVQDGSGSLGASLSGDAGADSYSLNLNPAYLEEQPVAGTAYAANDLFYVSDSSGAPVATTGGIRLLRACDLDGNDVTESSVIEADGMYVICLEEAGAYRVRLRCNEAAGGTLVDNWFYLAIAEEDGEGNEAGSEDNADAADEADELGEAEEAVA